jgi:hypothetical protein
LPETKRAHNVRFRHRYIYLLFAGNLVISQSGLTQTHRQFAPSSNAGYGVRPQAIHDKLTALFREAKDLGKLQDPKAAEGLGKATTHWLRNTAATGLPRVSGDTQAAGRSANK